MINWFRQRIDTLRLIFSGDIYERISTWDMENCIYHYFHSEDNDKIVLVAIGKAGFKGQISLIVGKLLTKEE